MAEHRHNDNQPKKNGSIDTIVTVVTTMPHPSIVTGLASTPRTDGNIAVTKSSSVSSSIGIPNTVSENSTSARTSPTRVPAARNVSPLWVVTTT